jgi:hypothetical protein
MPLADVDLELPTADLPPNVAELIADARRRIDALEDKSRAAIPAFVPSDFELVYRALVEIKSAQLATGRRFIEWGSGVGVIACLATCLGYEAVGIEIEPKLVNIADDLATAHRVQTQFACGSFVPDGIEPNLDWSSDVSWLSTTGPNGYDELELEPDDFDVVFAYPWPGEEQVIFDLFDECASVGALLLTYHGLNDLRLQRKVKR